VANEAFFLKSASVPNPQLRCHKHTAEETGLLNQGQLSLQTKAAASK